MLQRLQIKKKKWAEAQKKEEERKEYLYVPYTNIRAHMCSHIHIPTTFVNYYLLLPTNRRRYVTKQQELRDQKRDAMLQKALETEEQLLKKVLLDVT